MQEQMGDALRYRYPNSHDQLIQCTTDTKNTRTQKDKNAAEKNTKNTADAV